MSTVNFKSIANGVTKTNLKKFVNGDIGSRPLIKSASTNIARKELYRLERNHCVSSMRNVLRRGLKLS